MVLGMSLETFTLLHVLISLVGIASGLIVLYGFLTNRRLDTWTAVFLVTTALDQPNRLPFSVHYGYASHRVGNRLTGGARYCHRDTLHPPAHLEQDLRYCGLRRIVFQHFRSCGAVF